MTTENWEGYVYEHIHIASESIGRPLLENEIVHHLNGCRMDNSVRNLLILDRSQHKKLHAWIDSEQGVTKPKTKQVKDSSVPKVRQCLVCGNVISTTQNFKYCDSKCRGEAVRRVVRPSKETLEAELATSNWEALGRKYGVSGNAIRKWAKSYKLVL